MVTAVKLHGGVWYHLPGTGLDVLVAPLGPHTIRRKSNGEWDMEVLPAHQVAFREHSDRFTGFYRAYEPEYVSCGSCVGNDVHQRRGG